MTEKKLLLDYQASFRAQQQAADARDQTLHDWERSKIATDKAWDRLSARRKEQGQ